MNALKLSEFQSAQEVRDAIAAVRQRITDTKRDYIRTALNAPTADQFCSHLYASLTDLLRIWRNEFPEDYTQAQAAKDHELLQARLERAALQVERTELRLLEVGAKLQNPNDRMPWLTALEYQCAQDNVDAAHRDFRSIAQSVTSTDPVNAASPAQAPLGGPGALPISEGEAASFEEAA